MPRLSRQLLLPTRCEIQLDGQIIPYILKVSSRARFLRLEVRLETGLTVVVPRRFDAGRVEDFLRRKSRWVIAKMADCRRFRQLSADELPLTIAYLGSELALTVCRNGVIPNHVSISGNQIIFNLSSASNLNGVMTDWYRQQAADLITPMVAKLSMSLGVRHQRLTFRANRSRWGSCSHLGNLTFNWKLIMAPEPVIEYIVIHELCHLREMNHSARFWQLVAERCPEWRAHRQWLKEHEAELAARSARMTELSHPAVK